MNKLPNRFVSLIVVCVLAFGSNSARQVYAASNTYYVSLTGSDTNPGSLSAPFKTFIKAVSVLQAGDTLQVLAGTYNETLNLSKSGSASAPIIVTGSNGTILNMQGAKANGINVSGSYTRISKFEVIGATDFGILVTGKFVTIENNVVHDNVTKNGVGTCGLSTAWGSAVKVKIGGDNTTIRNNTVYDNCGEGIAITRGVTALVEGNNVSDSFGVNIYIDNSPFVTVQNNTSYCTGTHLRNGNRATGIALGEEAYTDWGAQLHDILVSGNTITDCRTGVAAYESNVGGTLTNVAILNNIIPSGQMRSISLQTLGNQNVLVSGNLIFNSIYVLQPIGVMLGTNTIGSVIPASTNPPSPTNTTSAPTFAPTATLPSVTNTVTPIQASPTAIWTATSLPVSPTAQPTFTSTALPTLPPPSPTAIPATATIASAFTETIFDDKDVRFVYSAGWQDLTKRQAYNGSHKLTTTNGSSMTFAFTGQSFSILYRGGPAYRNMEVYIDGMLVGTINQRTSSAAFQLRWDYPGVLASGNHTLKLVFITANTSDGTNGSIDAVIVR